MEPIILFMRSIYDRRSEDMGHGIECASSYLQGSAIKRGCHEINGGDDTRGTEIAWGPGHDVASRSYRVSSSQTLVNMKVRPVRFG